MVTARYWVGSGTVCRESGATYRQVTYWSTQGFLHSLAGTHPGYGTSHQYAAVEIDVARVLRVIAPLLSRGSVVLDVAVRNCTEHVRDGGRGTYPLARGLSVDIDALCPTRVAA